MTQFAIEHLPRAVATYDVTPVDYNTARNWLTEHKVSSLVRTTELVEAIGAGMGISLDQSDMSMTLKPGDEALLISLSFSVLMAWAEGRITPLHDDWRCLLLRVTGRGQEIAPLESATSLDLASN